MFDLRRNVCILLFDGVLGLCGFLFRLEAVLKGGEEIMDERVCGGGEGGDRMGVILS